MVVFHPSSRHNTQVVRPSSPQEGLSLVQNLLIRQLVAIHSRSVRSINLVLPEKLPVVLNRLGSFLCVVFCVLFVLTETTIFIFDVIPQLTEKTMPINICL